MKKSFMFSIFFMVLLLFSFNVPVFAEDYSFDKAEFVVQLNADGSADVLEKWEVNYYSGSFSRFYKNIYLDLPKEEQFTISNWDVKIGGIPCVYTENREDRPEFHYGLDKSKSVITYEVYAKSENETRVYNISYRLNDVVKCIDNDYYLFTYRFLPNGYKNNIKDFSVYIFAPDEVGSTEILYSTSGIEVSATSEYNGKTVYGEGVKAVNVSDMFKVKMRIDGNVFSNLPQSSYLTEKDLNSGNNNSGTNSGSLLSIFQFSEFAVFLCYLGFSVLFAGILTRLYHKYDMGHSFVIFIISVFMAFFGPMGFFINIYLLYKILKVKKIKKKIEENPNIVNEILQKWSCYFYNPAQYISNFVVNKYMAFLLYLIDLYNQGVIKFSSDYSIIYYPVRLRYDDYRDNILEVLDDCLNESTKLGLIIEQRNEYWELPTSYLYTFLSNVVVYKNIDNLMSQLIFVDGITNNNVEFRKDMDFLKDASKFIAEAGNFGYLTFGSMLYQYNNLVKLLCFALQEKRLKPSNKDMDSIPEIHSLIFTNMISDGYDFYYRETHRGSSNDSSSGGHGCSSCSSCSSCGGCGGVD